MAYPPRPHQEHDPAVMLALMKARPFAHLFTSRDGKHLVTRLPFAIDVTDGKRTTLRAHMNANNPQTAHLDGADVLVAFSGPDSYVSPNWRTKADHGATWDYTAVNVFGRAVIRPEREFFNTLIIDLAAAVEPNFKGVTDKPDWSLKDAPEGYVDALFPKLVSFEIAVTRVEGVSKLHQDFPAEDAQSVATHLEKSAHPESHEVAKLIRGAIRKSD